MLHQFKPFHGPKEFTFKDPDSGYEYVESDFGSLLKAVMDYRSANGYEPIEMLPQVVEHYLCNLPCHYNDCKPHPRLARSVSQYYRGGVALFKSFLFKEMVEQEVADKRAAQCVDCPFNSFPEKNNFDAMADSMALRQIGERKSKHHDNLGNCAVCSCLMRSKVFFKGNFDITDAEAEKMKLVNCWQLQHSTNPNHHDLGDNNNG